MRISNFDDKQFNCSINKLPFDDEAIAVLPHFSRKQKRPGEFWLHTICTTLIDNRQHKNSIVTFKEKPSWDWKTVIERS